MPLHVTIHAPPSLSREPVHLRVEADPVVIGRSPEAPIHLDDPSRVVSKQHAEIRRTERGVEIVDLGSKNFTYLDGMQLEPGRPYPVGADAEIQVGDFRIAIRSSEAPARSSGGNVDETVFAADFQNPFEESVAGLAEALQEIADAYDQEAPGRRDDALSDAVSRLDASFPPASHPGPRRVLSLLGLSSGERGGTEMHAVPARPESPPPPPDPPPPEATPSASSSSPSSSSPSSSSPSSSSPATDPEPSADEPSADEPSGGEDDPPPFIPAEARPNVPPVSFDRFGDDGSGDDGFGDDGQEVPLRSPGSASRETVTRALVTAVSRLIGLPWQFRHEFIGQTILQAPESAFLYDPPQALHQTLLDERVSPEERKRRLAYLREAVDAVARHQVAMLDGYKASVTTGAEQLLQDLSPAAHLEAARNDGGLARWIPPLAASAALDDLTEHFDEMQRGAWSVAERRVFRPAFIKAYLARMTAA